MREKLTVDAFYRGVTSGDGNVAPLFPLLTEGGRPAQPTEQQFNFNIKIGMVGGK